MRLRLFTYALSLFLLAFGQQARAGECDGLTVYKVDILGCGEGRCGNEKVTARLVSLTDMEKQIYTDEAAELARGRLEQTGYFREVSVQCYPITTDGTKLVFQVVPNRYVRKVHIKGNKVVYKSELQKRIFYRMGAVLNPGHKSTDERLERQVSTLTTYMKQQGLESAAVKYHTKLLEPDLVDLIITVDEGRVARIEDINFNITGDDDNTVPEEYRCPEINSRQLESILILSRGDLYTNRTARKVKKAIRTFLQSYGYQAPRVKVKFDPGTRVLTVNIKTSKCFSIIFFERETANAYGSGFERTREEALFKALPFHESGVFDLKEAERGIEELRIHYRLRGFLFAQVEMQYVDHRKMYPGWPYPLLGGVIYRITRGQPSEIRSIRFEGNKAFDADTLLSQMDTRRYDFFDVGGFLQVEQLFGDMDALRNFYAESGYFNVSYPDASEEDLERMRVQVFRKNDYAVYRYQSGDKAFDVIKPDWENAIRIVIRIKEGEGSKTKAVKFEGVTALQHEALLKEFPIQPGGPFSAPLVKTAIGRLENAYQKQGQAFTLEVECEGFDPPVPPGQCDIEKVQSRRVDVTFRAYEGTRHLMGELFVVGNIKTSWKVVERDFPKEGEPYDQAQVNEALRKLRNLGVFASVKLITIGRNEDPPREKLGVVLLVEENITKFIELSLGFQTIARPATDTSMHPLASNLLSNSLHFTGAALTGGSSYQPIHFPDVLLLGQFSYADNNLWGTGDAFLFPVGYGVSTRDPARFASLKPTYLDKRLFGTDFTMRTTPLIVYDRAQSLLDTFEYGIEAEFSRPLVAGLYLGLLTRISRITWKQPEEADFRSMEWQFETSPVVRLDMRDNPINPTSGTMLWAKVSYINALPEEEEGESRSRVDYIRYELGSQSYVSLRKTVVLALNLRYGDSFSLEGKSLPENRRFLLGGTNGVRGYTAGGVLQYDDTGTPLGEVVQEENKKTGEMEDVWKATKGGDTMLNGTFEIRFPLARRKGLWLATFLDAGALGEGIAQFLPQSFRFSAGLGVRWLIGGTIPLRLDYGFVIDRRCSEMDPSDTSKCASTENPGALDFGLLYTF